MSHLYIHIPFCKTRCVYCDFYSQTSLSYKDEYIQAVIRELELRKDYLEDDAIKTIYIGGGTPSLLHPRDFELIFNAINRLYDTSSCTEITLEANPEDMTGDYVSSIRQFPFNRISMGVQSFNEQDLLLLNRRHTARQALHAISCCMDGGFSNINIDLIYGLPEQTLQTWEANLSQALRLSVPHLSVYSLTYEEGTEIYRQLQAGLIQPVSEETVVLLFDMLVDGLEAAGYVHYEISNFSKPGFFSRHNMAYWTDRKYIGIGAAAHSYNHLSRQWNIASLPDYIKGIAMARPPESAFYVQTGRAPSPNLPPFIEYESIDEKTRYNDYILTHLRTMWGINLVDFLELFGQERVTCLLQQVIPFTNNGMIEKDENKLRITRKGMLLTDGIIRELML